VYRCIPFLSLLSSIHNCIIAAVYHDARRDIQTTVVLHLHVRRIIYKIAILFIETGGCMESQCPKCDSRKIKKELFRMATGGKWTARQRDFDGYYCQACGYVLGLYRPL